jgi:hypothetical protein
LKESAARGPQLALAAADEAVSTSFVSRGTARCDEIAAAARAYAAVQSQLGTRVSFWSVVAAGMELYSAASFVTIACCEGQ